MDPVILLWASGILAFVALALWADMKAVQHLTRSRTDEAGLVYTTTEEDA